MGNAFYPPNGEFPRPSVNSQIGRNNDCAYDALDLLQKHNPFLPNLSEMVKALFTEFLSMNKGDLPDIQVSPDVLKKALSSLFVKIAFVTISHGRWNEGQTAITINMFDGLDHFGDPSGQYLEDYLVLVSHTDRNNQIGAGHWYVISGEYAGMRSDNCAELIKEFRQYGNLHHLAPK